MEQVLNIFYSVLSSYHSSALGVDFGGTYDDTAHCFTLSGRYCQPGRQLTTFTPGDNEKIPFDLEVGISKRLEAYPFSVFYWPSSPAAI